MYALCSIKAAIGLPVWLLSCYETEVVSSCLCVISEERVSHPDTHKEYVFTHTFLAHCNTMCSHLCIPSVEFHLERLQNITSYPFCRLGRRGCCMLVFYKKKRFRAGLGTKEGQKSAQKTGWRYWKRCWSVRIIRFPLCVASGPMLLK